jgi:hypothetical protein
MRLATSIAILPYLLGCGAATHLFSDTADESPSAPNLSRMKLVSAGPFRGYSVEPFFLDTEEVRAREYRECIIDHWRQDRGDHPANGVSTSTAADYCRWKSKRLPTLWELQLAASRATRGPATSGSTAACARRPFESGGCPVGSHPADRTIDGILDLGGNVAEWAAPMGRNELAVGQFYYVSPEDNDQPASWDPAQLLVDPQNLLRPLFGFRCAADFRPDTASAARNVEWAKLELRAHAAGTTTVAPQPLVKCSGDECKSRISNAPEVVATPDSPVASASDLAFRRAGCGTLNLLGGGCSVEVSDQKVLRFVEERFDEITNRVGKYFRSAGLRLQFTGRAVGELLLTTVPGTVAQDPTKSYYQFRAMTRPCSDGTVCGITVTCLKVRLDRENRRAASIESDRTSLDAEQVFRNFYDELIAECAKSGACGEDR